MARIKIGVLPLLAAAGLGFALHSVFSTPTVVPPPPPVAPPRAPYAHTLAGSGVLEPGAARTTAIGAPFAGLVTRVEVEVGDRVQEGQALLHLDDRSLEAAAAPLEAALASASAAAEVARAGSRVRQALAKAAGAARDAAQARLARLQALPRPEEVAPLVARVEESRSAVADLEAQLARLEEVRTRSPGTVTDDDWDRRRFALTSARAASARAQADLDLTRAGAWEPDVSAARAALAEAEAKVEEARAAVGQSEAEVALAAAHVDGARANLHQNALERERAIVRAPGAATVLDVSVRPGAFAAANRDALLVLGDVETLLVRVDVDEESSPLVEAGKRAQAVVRGFPDVPLQLEFVRIEPYVRPKRSLTGATSERVDTRVLQVIYRVVTRPLPLYAGQQVDVFLEAAERARVSRP